MLHMKTDAFAVETKNSGVFLDQKSISDSGVIEGYGSVFGVVDSYNEVVEPGAFVASLVEASRRGRKVKMLWQHDPMQPIGVWDDLSEDKKGLYVKGRLLKDVLPRAAEAYAMLKEEALDGLSIGYRTIETAPHEDKQGVLLLKKLDLREVSIVTFAANERARVEMVKSLVAGGKLPTVREFEEHLRDAGFSKSLAAAIAGKAAPHLRGEPEAKANEATAFLEALLKAR
ncbi:HK97 family phage prohead protease [Xanthobacter sp. DSM 24535]|uniref:HK97 family phage prohead protease n=1 Tax=Roseixanthobacter psychrophilus TaxID=3119917 RepID=UPI003726D132